MTNDPQDVRQGHENACKNAGIVIRIAKIERHSRVTADIPTPPQGRNAPEFSVSELAGAIKRALEEGFGYVRLRGEISGYRGPHASGHCYFGLKDDKAKIDAVVWRGVFGKLRFKPEEGMEVIATGKISSFPGSSKYQIVIDALEPAAVPAGSRRATVKRACTMSSRMIAAMAMTPTPSRRVVHCVGFALSDST